MVFICIESEAVSTLLLISRVADGAMHEATVLTGYVHQPVCATRTQFCGKCNSSPAHLQTHCVGTWQAGKNEHVL
jgi:hypothetical protein